LIIHDNANKWYLFMFYCRNNLFDEIMQKFHSFQQSLTRFDQKSTVPRFSCKKSKLSETSEIFTGALWCIYKILSRIWRRLKTVWAFNNCCQWNLLGFSEILEEQLRRLGWSWNFGLTFHMMKYNFQMFFGFLSRHLLPQKNPSFN
jgi:hypothetical protein